MVNKSPDPSMRPMLAVSDPVDPLTLGPDLERGPLWVSPKYDGIRSVHHEGVMYSRTLKLIANAHIQRVLSNPILQGFDGELVVGSPTDPNCIQNTTSGVNSRGGEPDFAYFVFDIWGTHNIGYRQRKGYLRRRVLAAQREGLPVFMAPQTLCQTVAEVEAAVELNYADGYEGSIVRSFDDFYKYNRSTRKEGYLMKVKEYVDFEVHITGFIEMMHNENEAEVDERGLTKRSSHKANMVPAGTLGKMIGIDTRTGKQVTVGTGKMTAEEKLHVWKNQEKYLGRFSKARSGKHGELDLPRFPRHIVWRDPNDIA